MNPALLNLIVFFGIVLLVWVFYILRKSRISLLGKQARLQILREDVLKQLYHVENSNRTATISDLSGALKVRKTKLLPIIEEMTSSVDIKTKGELIYLSRSGREKALKIVRTHRLWEKYLAEKTGYKNYEWHFQAEKMEHKLHKSDRVKLDKMLGNPLYDPHGDPIPSEEGDVMPVKWKPLPSYPVNKPGKIVHIEDEPGIVYQQILAKKIFVGSHVIVTNSSDQEIRLLCEGEEHVFSPIVASNINIEPLEAGEIFEKNAIRLSGLEEGETGSIVGLSQECRGASRRRLLDLGFLPGTKVKVEMNSPMRDPIAYQIRNTSIALRNSLADLVLINKVNNGRL